MLNVVLIPATYNLIIKPVVFGEFTVDSRMKNCQCQQCVGRLEARRKKYAYSWLNGQFFVHLFVLAFFWYMCYVCFEVVKDIEPLKQFIPHELLGVAADATPAQVKKAYRKLSREKHPDKNPDNPEAVNEFIQITKAYTILTDEKARDNFIKYGNPDGKGSFAVGIALPNWLHDKQYQLQVLLAFFIIVVIIIPYYFVKTINKSQKDIGGIDLETRKKMTMLVDENLEAKRIPGILQFSEEFQRMVVISEDELNVCKRLKSLEEVRPYIPKLKNPKLPEIQVKPIVLLVAHMHGLLRKEELKIGKIEENIEEMLKAFPSLIDVMIEQTMMLSQMFRMGRSQRRIFAKTILTQIQFSQNLMSGGFKNKDHFSQLPYFGENECARLKQHLGKKNFYSFCGAGKTALTQEDRVEALSKAFGCSRDAPELKRKSEEIEKVVEALPLVKLTMEAGVTGEDEACVGDVLTCKMTVEFLKLNDGQRTGYVHSKEYPFLRRDNWFLIITDEQMLGLAAVEKIPLNDRVYVKEFKERIQRSGRISFTCVLVNDSYRGLDQVQKVEVNVLEQPTNRETIEYSKFDLKEIRALNPVQAAMIDQANEDTESDEEGDDEAAELRKKLASAGL